MRVLMVSDVFFPRVNGVSTAIDTYRRTLAAHGIEVRLVAPDYGRPCGEPWITRVPARPVPRDPEDRMVRWRALCSAVDRAAADCDLVHVQTPFLAHYAALRAGRRHRRPVIATYHTLFEEYFHHYAPFVPSPWLRGLARRFSRGQCNALDGVIVPSRAIHQRLNEYGVKTPLDILPTGIPLSRFASGDRARFRAQLGIADTRPVALYVGRVAHEKNIDFLVEALPHALRHLPDLLLLITGEGPALGHLQALVKRRRLEDCVRFVGYLDRQNELPDCYAAADAFVFSSRTETQGLVLVEAMAMGLPVVALSAMGTADILHERRGARVPEDDPQAFGETLSHLLGDEVERRRLGDEARGHAGKWEELHLAERLAGVYRRVVDNYRESH